MTPEQIAAIRNELYAIRDTTSEDSSSNFRRIEAILATIEGEGAEVKAERDNLRKFVDALIQDVCWGRGLPDDMDGGSVQDLAERMGVLVQVPHPLPCEHEMCGCEGEKVDYLFSTPWNLPTP